MGRPGRRPNGRVTARRALTVALAATLASTARSAVAQSTAPGPIGAAGNGTGIDTHLFRPSMDSKGLFTVNGSEVLGAKEFSFGLIADWGHNLLRADGGALIEHSFQGTLQANYGIANQLVVGLDIPIDLESGQAHTLGTAWTTPKLDFQGFGYIAAHAKWRLTRIEKGPGVALGLQVGTGFTDSAKSAASDPGFFYWPEAIIEQRFGTFRQIRLAANVGFRGHAADSTTLPLTAGTYADGSLGTFGAGASWRVIEPLDLVAETYGTYLLAGSASSSVKLSNEVVGGIKLFVERNSYLMLGGGVRYTDGFEAADHRAFLGFIFEPSIGDRDGDGLKDDVDKCPDDPEDFDGFEDEDGCPDPDNDKDGVLDVDDRCPNVPGPASNHGCPESKSDGDRDGDGIPDSRDKCPDEPEDRDGFQDEDGCPDPDNDHDGIPDVKDKCPNEPETFNGFEDEDGCPDKGSVIIQDNSIVILDKIQFAYNSADILPASDPILNAVATTLSHHPEFTLLEVGGHADERGADQYNLHLTQARVNSVVRALIARGIDRSRLRSKGYGEYCPLEQAHNEEAWEKNRRVEFKILKTADGPTGVELGCPNAAAHSVTPDPVK